MFACDNFMGQSLSDDWAICVYCVFPLHQILLPAAAASTTQWLCLSRHDCTACKKHILFSLRLVQIWLLPQEWTFLPGKRRGCLVLWHLRISVSKSFQLLFSDYFLFLWRGIFDASLLRQLKNKLVKKILRQSAKSVVHKNVIIRKTCLQFCARDGILVSSVLTSSIFSPNLYRNVTKLSVGRLKLLLPWNSPFLRTVWLAMLCS